MQRERFGIGAVQFAKIQSEFADVPTLTVGPKTPGTPTRAYCRPVMSAAREPEQTGQPEYQVVRMRPPAASRSMFGVFVVGWPVKPRSP